MTNINYSEIFFSAQGEGNYIGIPSLWLRFYLCNLECRGFGQPDPTDPSTYLPVGNELDLTDITDIQDLPIFAVGCDSAYSVAKQYKHLITPVTVAECVNRLTALLPGGTFRHAKTGQWNHMVFTGGEPMLPKSQAGMVAVLDEFGRRGNPAKYITVETNGTKPLGTELEGFISRFYTTDEYGGYFPDDLGCPEWFWSVSPKLWSTAGESAKRAICPDVVGGYAAVSSRGQLKYVVNGSEASWREVEENTRRFREAGCDFPVFIMGVGGTFEGLKMTEAQIADEAIQRGYNYTSRMHVHIWGNSLGK